MKHFKPFRESHLGSSIISWLNYVSAVGREYIIAESSIKIPTCEYLEVNGIQPNLESDHSKFTPIRKIDLIFDDHNSSTKKAYEFKHVKGDSTRDKSERIRIFNDLMRLYLLLEDPQTEGFFLITGITDEFKLSFENMDPRHNGTQTAQRRKGTYSPVSFYSEWFSFDENKRIKEIDLNNQNNLYKEVYDAFLNEYKAPFKAKTNQDLKLPDKLKTKLVFQSEEIFSNEVPRSFKIGIWQVLP